MEDDDLIIGAVDEVSEQATRHSARMMEYAQDHIRSLNELRDEAELRYKHHIEAAKQWADVADDVATMLGQPVPERSFTI